MLRRDKVSSIREENRVLFTSRDTFGYFAERYNFEVDTALASVSTEAPGFRAGEVRRTPLPRTRVNKRSKLLFRAFLALSARLAATTLARCGGVQ